MIFRTALALLFSTGSLIAFDDSALGKPQAPEVMGGICSVDAGSKTFRIRTWDAKAKTWLNDTNTALTWQDGTLIVDGRTKITMSAFASGKKLPDVKDFASLKGERAAFLMSGPGVSAFIQKVELVGLFAGESLPAMVGSNGAFVVGDTKVSCE